MDEQISVHYKGLARQRIKKRLENKGLPNNRLRQEVGGDEGLIP